MIQIHKKPEPAAWTAKCQTPGFTKYEAIPELKAALLAEQGYICAFCMRRIPVKDTGESETSKNAHLLSRTNHPEHQLKFGNLVGSCPGTVDGNAHCDKKQGSDDITLPIFNAQLEASISYGSHTGEIRSSNAACNAEMQNQLNLNNARLKANRLQTLEGIRTILETKKWKRATIAEKLREWTDFDDRGKLKPYCGVVIWYLRKKLHQA